MKSLLRLFAITIGIFMLAGCATGPKYTEMAGALPALKTEHGRIYIYRTTVLGAAIQPDVRLNDRVVGKAKPNGFFYVDVTPGDYRIATTTEVERQLSLVVEPGMTRYVRLDISIGFVVGHVYPQLVDNVVGEAEIKQCSYIGQP